MSSFVNANPPSPDHKDKEIERLREALEKIYEYLTRNTRPVSTITLISMARKALKDQKDA